MRPRMPPKLSLAYPIVRELALALPGVVEGSSYGTPAFKLGNQLVARMHQDGESLVVKVDPLERDLLIRADPKVFFITDHYRDYPYMQVHLSWVRRAQLRKVLKEALALVEAEAPPKPSRRRRRPTSAR
jgi:hypothetical protein